MNTADVSSEASCAKRTTGRFMAEVSNPIRADTSEPAAISAGVGRSGSTMRALTKSIAPSPFLSCRTAPGLKKSVSEGVAGGDGGAVCARAIARQASVAPIAAANTQRRVHTNIRPPGLPDKARGKFRLCAGSGGKNPAEAVGQRIGDLRTGEGRQQVPRVEYVEHLCDELQPRTATERQHFAGADVDAVEPRGVNLRRIDRFESVLRPPGVDQRDIQVAVALIARG